jgi:hypothetical protein
MHDDIRPLRPFMAGNPFYGLVSYGTLHVALVAAGIFGAVLLARLASALVGERQVAPRRRG